MKWFYGKSQTWQVRHFKREMRRYRRKYKSSLRELRTLGKDYRDLRESHEVLVLGVSKHMAPLLTASLSENGKGLRTVTAQYSPAFFSTARVNDLAASVVRRILDDLQRPKEVRLE